MDDNPKWRQRLHIKIKVVLDLYFCRIVKFAWRRSITPFDSVAKKLLVPVSMVGIFVMLKLLDEERGNQMIWLSIALPGVAFVIYFLWNLVNVHHQTHKKWAHKFAFVLIFLFVVVSTLLIEAAVKIRHLENPPVAYNVATIPTFSTNSVAQAASPPKPLPDKIIPNPEPPPPIVSAPQVAAVAPQNQLETNAADTGDAQSELERSRAELRALNAQQDKLRIQQEADAKIRKEAAWTNNLPIYRFTLETLHDDLTAEKIKRHDGIVKYANYSDCLPETNPVSNVTTEIWLQTQTNLDFKVAVFGELGDSNYTHQNRGAKMSMLTVSCSCGTMYVSEGGGVQQVCVSVLVPEYGNQKWASIVEAKEIIRRDLKLLIEAQIESLNKINK